MVVLEDSSQDSPSPRRRMDWTLHMYVMTLPPRWHSPWPSEGLAASLQDAATEGHTMGPSHWSILQALRLPQKCRSSLLHSWNASRL